MHKKIVLIKPNDINWSMRANGYVLRVMDS